MIYKFRILIVQAHLTTTFEASDSNKKKHHEVHDLFGAYLMCEARS
jgi:hypothetical protein